MTLSIKSYQTKPVAVAAVQFDGTAQGTKEIVTAWNDLSIRGVVQPSMTVIIIDDPTGSLTAFETDWIVREGSEVKVISDPDFKAMYTEVVVDG